MVRSYIESVCYVLGAYSGLLIGLSRETLFLLKSLTSVNGWKHLYVGTTPKSQKKIDYGESQPIHASSASTAGPVDIPTFLGTRPPQLVTPARRAPVYSSSPKFGESTENVHNSLKPAPYAGQPAQAMPFSLPAGASSQPIFDRPTTPPVTSPPQAQPQFERPSPASTPSPSKPLSAAAPSFSPSTSHATSSHPVAAAPFSAAPGFIAVTGAASGPVASHPAPVEPASFAAVHSAAQPSLTADPLAPTSLSVSPPVVPAVASEANRSPVSEEFTDDDMSSTAEEIGAQPISNASKIKKLRKRISSKLKGAKN